MAEFYGFKLTWIDVKHSNSTVKYGLKKTRLNVNKICIRNTDLIYQWKILTNHNHFDWEFFDLNRKKSFMIITHNYGQFNFNLSEYFIKIEFKICESDWYRPVNKSSMHKICGFPLIINYYDCSCKLNYTMSIIFN